MAEYQRLFQEYLNRPQPDGPQASGSASAQSQASRTGSVTLARREGRRAAASFDFTVSTGGQEIRWDAAVADDERARQALDEFYRLPDNPGSQRSGERAVPGRPHQARKSR